VKADASSVSPEFLRRRIEEARAHAQSPKMPIEQRPNPYQPARSANNGEQRPPFAEKLKQDCGGSEPTEKRVFLECLSPSELRDYQPPVGIVLVGDNHITRGSVFVIGGAPGVGKSRASVALAEAGATGLEWFGLKVHSKFKTLIVQNENGRFRLKQELAELNDPALDEYVRITPPPPYGLCFDRLEFRSAQGAERGAKKKTGSKT
jgi:hypothetical protein